MTLTTSQRKDAPSDEVEVHVTRGPYYTPALLELDQSRQGSRVLRELDALGAEGWDLHSSERRDSDQLAVRIFWLKRLID
jgi:hypothetical protein